MNTQEQMRKPILCVLVINRHELLSLPHFLLLLTSDTFNVANYWKLRGMMKKTLIFKFFFFLLILPIQIIMRRERVYMPLYKVVNFYFSPSPNQSYVLEEM